MSQKIEIKVTLAQKKLWEDIVALANEANVNKNKEFKAEVYVAHLLMFAKVKMGHGIEELHKNIFTDRREALKYMIEDINLVVGVC